MIILCILSNKVKRHSNNFGLSVDEFDLWKKEQGNICVQYSRAEFLCMHDVLVMTIYNKAVSGWYCLGHLTQQ